MKIEIAKYFISDTFLISGRGIVFAGYTIEGEVERGSYIEIRIDRILLRRIVGIEIFPQAGEINMALCIACKDDKEMKKLREIKPSNLTATIWKMVDI